MEIVFLRKRIVMLCFVATISLCLLFAMISVAVAGEILCQYDDQGLTLLGSSELLPVESFKCVIAPLVEIDHNVNLKASLREFYFDWHGNDYGLTVGRRIITFGPGRYGFPMLGPLGEEPRSKGYDQAGYYFNISNLKYQKFYALVPEQGYRGLLGQRTTYDWGNVTFGLSETAVVNESAPLYFYAPLPFVPVYFYQFLGYHVYKIPGVNSTANLNVDFDVTWQITPELHVYSEYYMDDRPWPRLDENNNLIFPEPWKSPWRVGYQTGLKWDQAFGQSGLALYGEYTRIDQFTYTGLNPELSYTFGGRALGDPLGPDADRINLELVSAKVDGWQWGVAWKHERHGEGKIGDVWEPIPGQTEVFLTGVVETTDRFDFTLAKNIGTSKLSATLGCEQVYNLQHIPDAKETRLKFKTVWTYSF